MAGVEQFSVGRQPAPFIRCTPGVRRIVTPRAVLLVEGAVYRIGGRRFDDPAATLLQRLGEHGPRAFAEVSGDFVACWVTPNATHAFKSFTSQYQLYWREADRQVASRLVAFADDGPPAFDDGYFLRHTLIVPGLQFHQRWTPLAGVQRVLPGELVSFSNDGIEQRQLVRRDYRYRMDREQRREDVAPEIARLLREIVGDQLDAHPGAGTVVEISGGLDSGFVAGLVGERRPGARGVMFSQPDLPSHRLSERLAQDVADHAGLDLAIVPPAGLPAVPLTAPAYGDEPSDFFWFAELFSAGVARFAAPGSLVFTGFGADQLFLRSPAFLPHLLAQRQWRAFGQVLGPAARWLSRSPLNLALQSALCQLPGPLYHRLAGRFAGGRWNPLDVSDVGQHRLLYAPVAWLRCGPEQAASFERERLDSEAALVGDGIVCDDWGYFAAPRTVTQPHFAAQGLVDASPFCDLRLLDFVYDQVSATLVHDFRGRYKELLREAQKGVVPESLRGRQNDNFVFNSFQAAYVAQAQDWFRSLLQDAPGRWVDPRGASRALEELNFGVMTSSTRSLVALLGYLSWRRSFVAAVETGKEKGTEVPFPA